jgi:glycine cleavage system H lipoate-binding protein
MKGRVCDRAFDCRECVTHGKWVEQHPVAQAQDERPFGLDFPAERFYHRGHTWVEVQPDGLLRVGLDDFGRRLIGQPDKIDAPVAGASLHVNGIAWKVRRNGTTARILAPVEGTVVYAGEPADRFILLVRPPAEGGDLRHLLCGAEVKSWLSRELERLQIALSGPLTGPSLADGGVLVEDLPANHPQANWDAVWGKAFLEP